ncbi:MAG: hypothetical protein CMM87_02485 [Rickettsiales bacterium]|nr:hypothetical protein [Rickettsiales bacterium]|tara:strand:- start:7650 stop:8489 length:840 start_codon:yes stop_codon:yes gene_type:complete
MAPRVALSLVRRQANRQGRPIEYPAEFEDYFLEELQARLLLVKKPFSNILYHGPPLKRVIQYLEGLYKVDVFVNGGHASQFLSGWRAHYGEVLPIKQRNYDLVVSMMHMHAVPEPEVLMLQYHAALKPDGLFLSVMPGDNTLNEIKDAALLADIALFSGAKIRIIPFLSAVEIAQIMQQRGFILPVVDIDRKKINYLNLNSFWQDLKDMGEQGFLNKDIKKEGLLPDQFKKIMERVWLEKYKGDVSVDILWLQGWTPGNMPVKQLKPGQGEQSLKDFLK